MTGRQDDDASRHRWKCPDCGTTVSMPDEAKVTLMRHAHEAGHRNERASIVAYLKRGAKWEGRIFRTTIWESAADIIERGEHTGSEGEKHD